jgi:hypothetical protein
MVFSVILTEKDGTTIMVCRTSREDMSAEVATPQMFSRIIERMAGEGGIVEVVSVIEVEL